ncbi:MAG TPA: amidohydrolase family protein, partial [Leptospiraceae bacterium]|nr:amidohydrolase family protein [Leptospiraceae bacterium]
TGMKNGTYELGGQEVTVKDRKAVLKDGTLAGSATNLFGCMCKAIEFGVPVDQAIFAATRNPARSIGIYDRTGSVHTGKEADLLLSIKTEKIIKDEEALYNAVKAVVDAFLKK